MQSLVTNNGVADRLQTDMYQYFIVVQPADLVLKKIEEEKAFFFENIQGLQVAQSPAHIAVASFQARDRMEETLIRYMERVTSTQASFTIALNNYSGVPSQTIFLRVQNPQSIRLLTRQLNVVNDYLNSCLCPAAQFIANPHLVIADRLSEVNYLQAMFEYSQRSFYETLPVNELVLLRRGHHFDAWKKLHVFRLQPPAYTAFQNSLFN